MVSLQIVPFHVFCPTASCPAKTPKTSTRSQPDETTERDCRSRFSEDYKTKIPPSQPAISAYKRLIEMEEKVGSVVLLDAVMSLTSEEKVEQRDMKRRENEIHTRPRNTVVHLSTACIVPANGITSWELPLVNTRFEVAVVEDLP